MNKPTNTELANLALELGKKSHERFKDRRGVEWKITFAFWAATGGFIYFLLKKTGPLIPQISFLVGSPLNVIFFIAAVIISGILLMKIWELHCDLQSNWLQPRLKSDRRESYLFELQAIDLINGNEEAPKIIHPDTNITEDNQKLKKLAGQNKYGSKIISNSTSDSKESTPVNFQTNVTRFLCVINFLLLLKEYLIYFY